jgi:hypothetical protein
MMAGITEDSMRSAWNALWKTGGPYDIRTAMRSGARQGLIWFRRLDNVSFPGTGPIVVYNREPWGVVTIDFTVNQVSQFHTMVNEGIEFADGSFTAKISFTELKLAGDYVVRRGVATGSLRLPGATVADEDDPNIALAKSYQTQLISSPTGSGRFMVGQYYDNNDAYVQCFTNQRFVNAWSGQLTNGKNTAYFAAQTSAAAQPQSTAAVNADPDYNPHSFLMQALVAGTCIAQRNTAAATAASTFSTYATGPSGTQQTVKAVMTTVSTTNPPAPQELGARAIATPESNPPWMADVMERARPILEEIQKEEDDVRRGILLREQTARPIPAQYRSYFPTGSLTVSGIVSEDANGGATMECTRVSGPAPDADIRLGVFPGSMHPELQGELDQAGFLRSVLARKAVSSLSSPDFLRYLSRMLTLAAGEKLGPANS